MRRKYRQAEQAFNEKGYGRLATYNSERARGIVHMPEYVAEMAEIKARFDAEQMARWEREGAIVVTFGDETA